MTTLRQAAEVALREIDSYLESAHTPDASFIIQRLPKIRAALAAEKKPQKTSEQCPLCKGSGNNEVMSFVDSTKTVLKSCNLCKGAGVVWTIDAQPSPQANQPQAQPDEAALKRLTDGGHVWQGVDPQDLRSGGQAQPGIVEDLVREIHKAVKRGERTEDHGLVGNLRCILDHVLPDPPGFLDEPPQAQPGWKPIETAPKDGTRLITWGPNDRVQENYVIQSGTYKGHWGGSNSYRQPTHWMPLPQAPEAK